jgi:hypothetical protein
MEDVPDVMPPAADSKPASSTDPLFKFWLDLFENAAQESEEESQYFHDEEPPQCLEDPAYQYQYPGCPFTGKSPQEERSGLPKITEPVPAVKPKSSKNSGVDHRTPIIGSIRDDLPRPACEEPPDEGTVLRALHKKLYGGSSSDQQLHEDTQIVVERLVNKLDAVRLFPLIGPAQMHHCQWKCTVYYYETVETGDPEQPQSKKPCVQVVYIDTDHLHPFVPISRASDNTSGKADSTRRMTDPKKYELPARQRQLVPGDSTEAQEEPAHPEVDTTEFRPSDARPEEFDPKPM